MEKEYSYALSFCCIADEVQGHAHKDLSILEIKSYSLDLKSF